MLKSILVFFLLAITWYVPVQAQNATNDTTAPSLKHPHSRISLIICTEGNESWESFGHSTVRVIDSTRSGPGRDLVYNYATFDLFDGSFLYKFIKGNMHAFLEPAPYDLFIKIYAGEGRGVTEQEFLLNEDQIDRIQSDLENNSLIENRYFSYDLVTENCTTLIRDLLTKNLGPGLIFAQVAPGNSYLTVRKECEEYCKNKHWLRLALEVFFASKTDKPINNSEAMFTPLYLDKGLSDATLNDHKLCSDKIIILEDKLPKPTGINHAFAFILIISLFTIVTLSVKRFQISGKIMSLLILVTSGILGCCILYGWFGSTHPAASNNFNILWALPTNILIPFFGPKIKAKYAIVAMFLLGIALVLDLLKIQVMPLFELGSFLLAMLYIYFIMYRNSKTKSPSTQSPNP